MVKKLLFVDDNASLGRLYVMILKREGWEITHVETVAGAMKFMDENDKCPFVLLDYKLSDANSDILAQQLRVKYSNTYIIMISGDPPHREKIMELLEDNIIDDFLEKPFSVDIVLEKFGRRFAQP